jgi:predicted lactoylglutathione lyase
MNINQIRTFIPSKDFSLSKQFYLDLGFKTMWQDDNMALFGIKQQNFFLQKYYQEDWANNCMMQMHVDDLEELYHTCVSLKEKYTDIKLKQIFTADYGRTFHLIDPTGVLWHMTEVTKEVADESKLICDEK